MKAARHIPYNVARSAARLICLTFLAALLTTAFDRGDLKGQQTEPPRVDGEDPLVIVVESVSGTVNYVRAGQPRERVTLETRLRQGDRLYANPGSICKLEFQRPGTGEVTSATIVRGYCDLEITQAMQLGASSETLLDVRQGVIRAGVVRSAVPPSFRIRTPHSVVAVRGTEIAELEASNDRGDSLKMGVVGSAMSNDAAGLFRSAQRQQQTLIRTEGNRRGGRLLRAIEVAILRQSRLISGPHRRGHEVDFTRRHLVSRPIEFNSGEFAKSEGNPNRDRLVNGTGRRHLMHDPHKLQQMFKPKPPFHPPMNMLPPSQPPNEMMDPFDPPPSDPPMTMLPG